MDKIVDDISDILSNLTVYFSNIKAYLKNNEPERYDKLSSLDIKLEDQVSELQTLISKPPDNAALFKMANISYIVIKMLDQIYYILDVKIRSGDEISKTQTHKLTNLFDSISSMYRKFVNLKDDRLIGIYKDLGSKLKDPKLSEISLLFRKYPGSAGFYQYVIESSNFDPIELQKTLDDDKSYIMGEEEWIEPYLSFNLRPFKSFKSMEALARSISSSSVEIKDACEKEHLGLVIISRLQKFNAIINLPVSLDATKGLCSEHLKKVIEVSDLEKDEWKIDRLLDGEFYLIVEDIGSNVRILSSGTQTKISKDDLRNIINKKNDRPAKYNALIESKILSKFNKHLLEFMKTDFPLKDVPMSISKCHHNIMKFIRALPPKMTPKEKIFHPQIQSIFKSHILGETKSEIADVQVYICIWIAKKFVDECIFRFNKIEINTGSREQELVRIDSFFKEILDTVMKRNSTIFSIIPQKEHIVNSIKLGIL